MLYLVFGSYHIFNIWYILQRHGESFCEILPRSCFLKAKQRTCNFIHISMFSWSVARLDLGKIYKDLVCFLSRCILFRFTGQLIISSRIKQMQIPANNVIQYQKQAMSRISSVWLIFRNSTYKKMKKTNLSVVYALHALDPVHSSSSNIEKKHLLERAQNESGYNSGNWRNLSWSNPITFRSHLESESSKHFSASP